MDKIKITEVIYNHIQKCNNDKEYETRNITECYMGGECNEYGCGDHYDSDDCRTYNISEHGGANIVIDLYNDDMQICYGKHATNFHYVGIKTSRHISSEHFCNLIIFLCIKIERCESYYFETLLEGAIGEWSYEILYENFTDGKYPQKVINKYVTDPLPILSKIYDLSNIYDPDVCKFITYYDYLK